MGHTKSYTKVVLEQTEAVLGTDQPALALVGKCIKVKITGTHKWHVSGVVVDLNPAPVKVSPYYFFELDSKRKEMLRKQLQEDLAAQKEKELRLKLDQQTTQEAANAIQLKDTEYWAVLYHLMGMAAVSLATFFIAREFFN